MFEHDSEIPAVVSKVADGARKWALNDCKIIQVETDYYEWALEKRKVRLGAPSVHHLCKSLLFENTRWKPKPDQDPTDVLNPIHPKYILVVVQYTEKISSEKLNMLMRKIGEQSAKAVNMRIAPEEVLFN